MNWNPDIFSFLADEWPERGGDARLNQPIKMYAGGSATNTTTHLKGLIRDFHNVEHATDLALHTVLNPSDHYGNLLLDHAKQHGYTLFNCYLKHCIPN